MKDLDKPHLVQKQEHIQQKQNGKASLLSNIPLMTTSSSSSMSMLLKK